MKNFLCRIIIPISIVAFVVAAAPSMGNAVLHNTHTVWGTSVDSDLYEAYVQWDSGIFATGNWANSNTTLEWYIEEIDPGIWLYEYTWNTDAKELSHIIIEFTTGVTLNDILDGEASHELEEVDVKWNTLEEGNPGLPGNLYGIKLDLDEDTTEFGFGLILAQPPVWGNFYAKDGQTQAGAQNIIAYNTGFSNPETGIFIARPNGVSVPEPATMLLLGSGLVGIAALGRRKFRKK